jgi:hypothetical protein
MNNLFDPTFQLCMLYYLIGTNENLLIFNILPSLSLINKQFCFAKMHLTNLINMNFLSVEVCG